MHLFDVFLQFGAPAILQSDNGKEFRAKVVEELKVNLFYKSLINKYMNLIYESIAFIKVLWPDLKIVHGRPRHPQSEGSVERANGEVKRLIGTWIRTTKRKDWSIGIRIVANQYNRAKNRNLEVEEWN